MNATISHPSDRRAALTTLAIRLAELGSSEAPRAELSDLQPALDALIAAGALVDRGGQIRFAHESLRDFVYAEAFAGSETSLATYLVKHGQDLADRWLVRQVLGYLRGIERPRYTAAVAELLEDPAIRFHIRDIVFETLRGDPQPSINDWRVIEPFVVDAGTRNHWAAWSVVVRPAWFALLDRLGVVIRWMASESTVERDLATNLLRAAQREASDRAAVLMAPFVGQKTDWGQRLRWIVGAAGGRPGREYFDLLRDCIDRGLFDDGDALHGEQVWEAAHDLPNSEPEWAVELIDSYFRRGLVLAASETDPFGAGVFPRSEHSSQAFIATTARHAPRRFIEAILDPVIRIADATAWPARSGDPIRVGDPWEYRWAVLQDDFRWGLFYGLDEALRAMAKSKPRSLRPMLTEPLSYADIDSIRYLIYRAWGANAHQFKDDAFNFLLREPPPFHCATGTNPYGATRELIAALQAVAPRQRLYELQEYIARFVPAWERTPEGRGQHRFAQWQLLAAFDESRLSPRARQLWRELTDKFGAKVQEETLPRAGFVGPPIAEASAKRMTDEQWVRAIRKYDRADMHVIGDAFKGGAIELSRVLESETAGNPDRFARLAAKLPDHTHPAYVEGILRGLGDADELVDGDLFFAALLHFFEMPGRPGGRWIQRPIARLADQDIPPAVIELVVWFATKDPDPGAEDIDKYLADESRTFSSSPFTVGLNSVRGMAAQTVSALVWPKADRLTSLLPAVQSLAEDRTLAVRACAASAVQSVLRHDPEAGLKLFMVLTDAHDLLLAENPVERLTGSLVVSHYEQARGVVRRMLESELPRVKQAGGRLAAFAALYNPSAADDAEAAVWTHADVRLGVAQVAAGNVGQADHQQQCQRWLTRLFQDTDERVRKEASDWCRLVNGEMLGMFTNLIRAHIDSPAYADDELPLLWALDGSPAPLAELGLQAVESFISRHADQMGDITTRSAGTAMTASQLAMRAYTSSTTAEMRARALDVIDRLLAARVSQMQELIGQYEPEAIRAASN